MFKEQIKAFDKFKELKIGALFMKMGTGKTKIALELANYNNIDNLIYIAPFSTLKNIEAEFIKWSYNRPYVLMAYETIQSSNKRYVKLLSCIAGNSMIIADESIFIKNDKSKRFKRLLELRKKCDYALILNGTPLTKNEWDLYNQMEFLSPLILNMSRVEFLNKFFKRITFKKSYQSEQTYYKFSEVNADYLKKLIQPYVFETDLVFNQKEVSTYIEVEATEKSICDYEYEKRELLQLLEENNFNNNDIMYTLLKMNQISSIDINKLERVIQECKNKQSIVFCNYLKEIEFISSSIDCFVITGKTKNRQDIINKFQDGNKPLIMTYGVGSYSLNLQFCNEIIFSSINYDYGKMEQAKARIKRIGQDKDIKYTYILTNFNINKLILDNLKKKQNLSDLVKENLKKGDKQWLKNI